MVTGKNVFGMNNQQVGKYGEYLAKMKFILYDFDVYTSEIDDKAIDFIIRKDEKYYDIQVKTVRRFGSVYLKKRVFSPRENLMVALILLKDVKEQDCYLIPSEVWENPNSIFKSRDYIKEGLTSTPEWEINYVKKYLPELEKYRFDIFLSSMFLNKAGIV